MSTQEDTMHIQIDGPDRDATMVKRAARRGRQKHESRDVKGEHRQLAGDESVTDEIVIDAGKRLTLRCGESSITLTAAGKIIIRGKYIVSRSSGVQRIKGGSVEIN